MSDIGAIAQALEAVFGFYDNVISFVTLAPGRIARQREAARPDALRPGQFQDKSSLMTTILIVLSVFALLFFIIIYSSTKK